MSRIRALFLCGLAVLIAASRIFPHPPNFAPVTAVALFAGAVFTRKLPGVLLALGALLLSDVLFQLTYMLHLQPHWGFYSGQWMVYAATFATVGIGRLIRNQRNFVTIVTATLGSSVLFFLVTNLVWPRRGMPFYPETFAGQLMSYQAAIPYFKYTIFGDLFYAGCLFGSLAMVELWFPALRDSLVKNHESNDSLA